MLRRRLNTLCKVLLALVALALAFLVIERLRGQISLTQYKRKLTAQGEKLTPGDLRSALREGEDGAPAVFAAIQQLSNGVVLPNRPPPRMKLMPSGRAIACFREAHWVQDKVTNHWDQLAADLKTNEAPLTAIRAALQRPVLNSELDLSQGVKLHFSHLAPAKSLTYWLGAGSQLALHEGKPHAARADLVAQIRLPRLLAEDRIAVSELVRIAMSAIARADTWEALQAEGWADEDLAALQKAWQEREFAATMARSFEGERIFCDVSYGMIRRSNEDAVAALFGLEEFLGADEASRPAWERLVRRLPLGEGIAEILKKQFYCRIWRFAWSHQAQRRGLEAMQRLIEIARQATAEKSFAAVGDALGRVGEESLSRNLYDRLRYPDPQSVSALSGCVKKAMQAQTERSITVCAIALKRHALRHGKWPLSLDTLVPEFLAGVPVDYMDGKPMKYRLNAEGGFTLYSVGLDGRDDGGDVSLPPDEERVRNLWVRKDFVWPAPALPEELETCRKEAFQH
jgi:hypothetical protein